VFPVLFEGQESVAAKQLVRVELCETRFGLVVDEVRVAAEALAYPAIGLFQRHDSPEVILDRRLTFGADKAAF